MRLFDTTYIIDLVNSDEGAVELARKVDEEGSGGAVSAVSVHEYLFGVHHRYRSEAELKEKLASALDELGRFETVAFTKEVAEASSKIGAELARAGRVVGINDVYIGATALVHKLPLVTRNRANFARMRGVETETY
ncbi:MAG: type II toxin-antitoxin system VapC family toxin [Nitrososphaerota archaeon]|nr:type II toxin-antitoxin system VapC family toxin [Nitrososphaerota archaeon]MDG7028174.1 type II toxin-antitoxin system VapC family toxin [Nitrososphaerota archaeon]